MMFLSNIILSLSDRHLYNVCGEFACVCSVFVCVYGVFAGVCVCLRCVWCEVTHIMEVNIL